MESDNLSFSILNIIIEKLLVYSGNLTSCKFNSVEMISGSELCTTPYLSSSNDEAERLERPKMKFVNICNLANF